MLALKPLCLKASNCQKSLPYPPQAFCSSFKHSCAGVLIAASRAERKARPEDWTCTLPGGRRESQTNVNSSTILCSCFLSWTPPRNQSCPLTLFPPAHYLSPQNRGVTPCLKVCGHSLLTSCWEKLRSPWYQCICSAPSCLLGRSLQKLLPGRRSHEGAKSSRELPSGSPKQQSQRRKIAPAPLGVAWFLFWAHLIRQDTGCITHCSLLLSSEQLAPRSPRAAPATAQ